MGWLKSFWEALNRPVPREGRDSVEGLYDFTPRAQQVLGRMHDWQMLMDRARQVQGALTPTDAATWDELDTLVHGIEDDCRRLHARYVRERPALDAFQKC